MDNKEMRELEGEFIGIRSDLRLLRVKLDTRLSQPFYQPVSGFAPAEEKEVREMRKLVNQAIMFLDHYEDAKVYHEEFEQQTIRMASLAGAFAKEEVA